MENERRSQRNGAGQNRLLSSEYEWPKQFGNALRRGGTVADINVQLTTDELPVRSPQGSSRPKENEKMCDVSERRIISGRPTICNAENASKLSQSTKHSSRTNVSIEKKRIALEIERKRQKLEEESRRIQFELQEKQKEIEANLRLLRLEEELENAELNESERNNSRRSEISVASRNVEDETEQFKAVSDWVNNTHDFPGISDVKHARENQDIAPMESPYSHNSDIKLLCETITNVVNSVATNSGRRHSEHSSDKFQIRQLMEKDFPFFDGNPQEWPIFYKHLKNLCTLCDYSNEELMMKLRRYLRGEAKSVVAGMLLTADNLDLVIHTLETRFGRPEFIIETMISRIKHMPFIRDNLEKLIQFSSEVSNMVSIMKSLETRSYLENPQLIKELLSKLPDLLKLGWGEIVRNKKGCVNLEDFAFWLGELASSACYVSTPYRFEKFGQKPNGIKGTERILSTSENKEKICHYCDKKVHESSCPKMENDVLDDRWKIVTEKKLCFSCLGRNHQKFKCKKRKACGIMDCKLFHHPLLHKHSSQFVNVTTENEYANDESQVQRICATKNEKAVLLRMIPIRLHGPNGVLSIYALCDEASTVTLLDSAIAEKLGLKGSEETLCLQWTSDEVSTQTNSLKLDLKVSKTDEESKTFFLRGVRTLDSLSLPAQTMIMTDWKIYPHLKGIPVNNLENVKPVMIIGQDNISLIIPRQIRCGPENVPVATRCKLGWSVHGPASRSKVCENLKAHILHICDTVNRDDALQKLVSDSFSTECFGVMVTPQKITQENSRALKIMSETVKDVGNRYEIGLLWRNDQIQLPESKYRAIQRLKCVERKCQKNAEYAQEYHLKIKYYEKKGYITKLNPDEAKEEGPRTWYLPHFAVENPNKPNKIRLVFDAAAKSHGVSLNDVLLSGPDLLQSLVAILWKFRQGRYGFCGDVKEMFHQVQIRKEDRSSQRLLWRNLEYDRPPDIYEMNVMTFGATCSPVCAQFVKNWNSEKLADDPEIRKAIIEKFYVDDYLDAKDTEEDASKMISEVRRVMKLGGFEVVNWMTNSQSIQEELKGKNLLATSKNIDEASSHRVLGLWWNTIEDEFSFKLNLNIDKNKMPTKRMILKCLMSVFDPLGFIACFTIRGKILMQDVWRSGVEWDQNVSENMHIVWKKWLEDLEKITEIRIPRCYSLMIPQAHRIEIHTFSDSSEKAFAAVSYLRVIGDRQIDVSLIAAKTRVAPLKPLSIPRLELQGAVMASRLAQSVRKELEIPIEKLYFWTDSQCVLKWIRGDGRNYKQFVAHRIGEIQEITNSDDWRWVPSQNNAADEATRTENSSSSTNTVISYDWFHGPKFLKLSEESWPKEDMNTSPIEADQEEKKKESQIQSCLFTNTLQNSLPNVNNFSSWLKLIRTTAWCLRFIKYTRRIFPVGGRVDNLTVSELNEADNIWIKQSQQEGFGEEIRNLRKGKPLEKQSRIYTLCPELRDDGILVLGGRTSLATCMDENTKKPIILCSKHAYTKLLIVHYHEKYRHKGVELILNELRQKFWIINGRSAVKSIFSKCLKCKFSRSKPEPPMMGQLPNVRLREEIRPFINVGMDYFGPLLVKIGRRQEKRWGVLFTCLSVRAIHLEISHTINSDSAIMAILRLAARRGKPEVIYCDNGTNFRAASKELQNFIEDIDTSVIQDTMSAKGIQFRFNPPAAPHMSGVWERLIGSVKRVIGKVLYQQPLREETLQTYFAEAEFLINSRPLTRVSGDPDDLEALTPNHFLMGSSNGECSPIPNFPDGDCLRREWKRTQSLLDSFWKRWVKEYLPTLTKRNKWTKDHKPIQINDVVILVDDNAPRYKWKLGRIINVFPGPDERVRVVDVKTSTGEYRRPVTKICRLELDEN